GCATGWSTSSRNPERRRRERGARQQIALSGGAATLDATSKSGGRALVGYNFDWLDAKSRADAQRTLRGAKESDAPSRKHNGFVARLLRRRRARTRRRGRVEG